MFYTLFELSHFTLPSQLVGTFLLEMSMTVAFITHNSLKGLKAQDSSDEDEVEKDVAYLAKNFRKFLKFKRDGKSFEKGKFSNFKKDKKTSKRRILKIPHCLKWSYALSSKGMGM